ncbi:MAG: alpha/beta fold hydrolase [Hyphomicrobium sp.]
MRTLLTIGFVGMVLSLAQPAGAEHAIIATEHTIDANGMRLRIWEKSQGPTGGKPIVVLAHGSGTAGQESFDLQVDGKTDTSLMDVLAREGFDVFAPDVRGFGRSTHPDDGVTTEDAAADLVAVIGHVLRIRGASQVNVVAWSWGTQYAGLAVIAIPQNIARYVSYAQMHAQSPDVVKRRERLDEFRSRAYMTIPETGWTKRFASMTPDDCNDPDIVAQFAKSAAAIEKTTPAGPQIDMTTRLPMVDAAKITVPALIIHGQYDDVADAQGLLPFFAALPSPVKSYVIVPGGGHMAHLQNGRVTLQRHIVAFLKP